jgi:hypothetical protein
VLRARQSSTARMSVSSYAGSFRTAGSETSTCGRLGMSERKVEHARRRLTSDGHPPGEAVIAVHSLVVQQRDRRVPANHKLVVGVQRWDLDGLRDVRRQLELVAFALRGNHRCPQIHRRENIVSFHDRSVGRAAVGEQRRWSEPLVSRR